MTDEPSKIRKNVTIKRYQEAWLKQHPEINLSGLIQELLDEMMSSTKSVKGYVDMLIGDKP